MEKECVGKKVCIIRSNPVNPDSRVEKEAWTLKKEGYEVHILAWDRDSDRYELEDFVEVANLRIPITRLGHKASFGEGLKNIKSYLAFQFHMRRWLKQHKFDVIHSCDFDTAFFSYDIARKNKQKFIFDIFDFRFSRPTNFMQKCVKKAQYKIINKADATIICTEERKNQIAGSNPKRLVVIHNTPSPMQIGTSSVKFNEFNIAGKVKIAYVGILQDYRLLKEIVEVIKGLTNVDFHVGGFGKYEKYFSDIANIYDNIYFHGRLSYADTLALEQKCDIMLAIYDPLLNNHFYAAPNKFYESLMLGKPVIMVKNTGMSKIVEDNDIGVLIEYSKEGFKNGLNELIAKKNEWDNMSTRMTRIYREVYQWENMEMRLIELYGQLV